MPAPVSAMLIPIAIAIVLVIITTVSLRMRSYGGREAEELAAPWEALAEEAVEVLVPVSIPSPYTAMRGRQSAPSHILPELGILAALVILSVTIYGELHLVAPPQKKEVVEEKKKNEEKKGAARPVRVALSLRPMATALTMPPTRPQRPAPPALPATSSTRSTPSPSPPPPEPLPRQATPPPHSTSPPPPATPSTSSPSTTTSSPKAQTQSPPGPAPASTRPTPSSSSPPSDPTLTAKLASVPYSADLGDDALGALIAAGATVAAHARNGYLEIELDAQHRPTSATPKAPEWALSFALRALLLRGQLADDVRQVVAHAGTKDGDAEPLLLLPPQIDALVTTAQGAALRERNLKPEDVLVTVGHFNTYKGFNIDEVQTRPRS